ncbi:MAG: hypothetical protein ICV77_09720 [Cyanobacteria bacterium Co-bin8]|nr:hypothetical protein [Cyanobacteria bacterium Co-bin8]
MKPFYKLTHDEAISMVTTLRYSELKLLLYLKTLNPFGDNEIEINFTVVGEVLGIDPRTVSRSLIVLAEKGLVGDIEVTTVRVTIHPYRCTSGSGDPVPGSGDPESIAGALASSDLQNPSDYSDYSDYSDRSGERSDDGKENGFDEVDPAYKDFLIRKSRQLPIKPRSLERWLRAMVKRKTYLSEFEAWQETRKVPAAAPDPDSIVSRPDYFLWLAGRDNGV